jgi:hypothetical protein
MDVQNRLRILFSPLVGKDVPPALKYSFPKTEKDILDIIPSTYFTNPQPLSETVMSQVGEYMKVLDQRPPSENSNYKRTIEQLAGRMRDGLYYSENTFSSRWTSPRTMYGYDDDNLLVAPSSTNPKVQLLAVLPPQSMKYFPEGIVPSNRAISWMFPTGIPVDFTFRDRVHAATLIIPPPNIPYLENFMKIHRSTAASDQIRQGMFPRGVRDPRITPTCLKKSSYYNSIRDVLKENLRSLPGDPVCVDVLSGVGISSLALDTLGGKVYAYEPNRENFSDLIHNIREVETRIIAVNEYFNPMQMEVFPDLVFFDLPHETGRRGTRDIRINISRTDRDGTPIEDVVEDVLREFTNSSKEEMNIVIKLPAYGFLKRIGSTHRLKTRFVKDVVHDTSITYAIITVTKSERGRPRDRTTYDYYSTARDDYQPASPAYVARDDYQPASPAYVARDDYRPSSPAYVARDDYRPSSPAYVARDDYQPASPEYAARDDYFSKYNY